jgi:uncharacterized protein
MLGRLSKWLRVMGCDAHYQPFYLEGIIDRLIREDRMLLSRNRRITDKYISSLFIESEQPGTQLQEIRKKGYLSLNRSQWFTRCLACNIQLIRISIEDAKANIPEYIFSQNNSEIRFCPLCGRYFWPGSHKIRMMRQLSEWLLID